MLPLVILIVMPSLVTMSCPDTVNLGFTAVGISTGSKLCWSSPPPIGENMSSNLNSQIGTFIFTLFFDKMF